MKRSGVLHSRTQLHVKGNSDTAQVKEEIQIELRRIVIARDGGCILRDAYDVPSCGGYAKDGHFILQADAFTVVGIMVAYLALCAVQADRAHAQ